MHQITLIMMGRKEYTTSHLHSIKILHHLLTVLESFILLDVLKTVSMLHLSQTICKGGQFLHFTLLENLILLNKIQMFSEDIQCLPSQSQLKF